MQLNQSDDFHLLNPVIALNIVDFTMFEDSDKVISNFKLLEKEKFIHYSDDIELIFIELPKFTKTLEELQTLQDKWIFFIQNSGRLEFIPEHIEQEIKAALAIANEANLSLEELELQRKRKEFIFIQKSSIELASERALKQGLEQGIKQGMEQALRKIVMNSHQSGMPIQSIQAITGLSEKDIKSMIG